MTARLSSRSGRGPVRPGVVKESVSPGATRAHQPPLGWGDGCLCVCSSWLLVSLGGLPAAPPASAAPAPRADRLRFRVLVGPVPPGQHPDCCVRAVNTRVVCLWRYALCGRRRCRLPPHRAPPHLTTSRPSGVAVGDRSRGAPGRRACRSLSRSHWPCRACFRPRCLRRVHDGRRLSQVSGEGVSACHRGRRGVPRVRTIQFRASRPGNPFTLKTTCSGTTFVSIPANVAGILKNTRRLVVFGARSGPAAGRLSSY